MARVSAIALAAALAFAPRARAQHAGRGFLFREPRGALALRGGFALASAGSDIFSFTTSQLTVNRSDFNAASLGMDLAFQLTPRLDVALGVAYARANTPSEFRDWVDQNDLPIRQMTAFTRIPVTASLKAYLTPRGRSIGRFAWIPRWFAVYAGAGAGGMWYQFRQQGEFVDFATLAVFNDRFESSGWTPTAHAMVGTEISVGTRFLLITEMRYAYARAKLSQRFAGFDPIDLAGASATTGVAVRF
ncbi:MAG: hypothetical protein HY700_07520 [Gemmatimonadetes bacterium]|nr:hypothetical protein [Gemmatimonadota bacterium]